MLTLLPTSGRDRTAEARAVIEALEVWRPLLLLAVELLLVPLLGVCLLAAGFVPAGCLMLGAATSLALTRYGPSWWPGKR